MRAIISIYSVFVIAITLFIGISGIVGMAGMTSKLGVGIGMHLVIPLFILAALHMICLLLANPFTEKADNSFNDIDLRKMEIV